MREFPRLAVKRNVVRRATLYAVSAGLLLILINYRDAIRSGHLAWNQAGRMAITVFVPYAVSTLSSIAAVRKTHRSHRRA